jgi:peptide/nickel transport system substrate-binding protein
VWPRGPLTPRRPHGITGITKAARGASAVHKDEIQRRVDAVRAQRSELENHVIDEYRAGYIGRREFMKRGAVVGMSLPMLSFLAAACGSGEKQPSSSGTASESADVAAGGTLRTGLQAPGSALDPIKVNNQGALAILGQSGEYLIYSDRELKPVPRLAESWKPNRDGSQWTFKIRQGVKFQDGKPMTAEDVAATFNLHADADNGSNALSAFTGVLSKGGAQVVDDSTVMFELEAPNGNFPFNTSSDNYNLIILPKGFDPTKWSKDFQGTGPWKLEKYTPNVGVNYVKNPDYWDPKRQPKPDRNEVKFYEKEEAAILGIQGGEVDVLAQFSAVNGKPLLTDPNVSVIELRASQHRLVHLRTDKEPFNDKRVRQAVALLINRDNVVKGLLEEKADYGNDSPFAPVYPSTDKSVPQRKQDVERAKALLSEAGKSNIDVELRTWTVFEVPQYAQLIQNDLKQAGINVKLNITDAASYYGDSVYGQSPWLDSTFGITEYGHRGVPNVFLGAPLKSDGTWNSAHFKNKEYDKLANEYVAAIDLQSQRTAAKKIQEMLLDEVPIIISYFYFYLTATKPTVAGVDVSAMGHVDVNQAGQKA